MTSNFNKSLNILLINHYAGSPRHGMEFRPYYLGREWTQQGHNVTIVAASFSHVRASNPQFSETLSNESIDGIEYMWLNTPSYKGNGFSRILNMISFIGRLHLNRSKIVKSGIPDIVIASSTYPLDVFPAYWLARSSGARLVFEVHDLWPLSPKELGKMSRFHPFILITQLAEDFAVNNSDFIVSILGNAKCYLESRGMNPKKFVHIPNGICLDEWQRSDFNLPSEHSTAILNARSQGNFLIGYAGAHGLANSLETLIDAAGMLADVPITFVLIGDGPEKAKLEKKVFDFKLTNVIFLSKIKKAEIPHFLRAMDVLYIGLKKTPLFEYGTCPNKLLDYMMAGRPVIHAIETGTDIVKKCGCGISIQSESPSDIVHAVLQLFNMPQTEREKMGMLGMQYVIQNHDYRILAKEFISSIWQE